jgi:hypothetical protein
MLKQILETRNPKQKGKFQVLYLRNDASQQVEVCDVKQVDFLTIQEHLEQGESVFITSRSSQKISSPKPHKASSRSLKTRVATAFTFEPS